MRVRPLAAGKTAGGGGGRPAHLRARGAGSQGRLLRLRPVQDGFPAAGGVPADPVEQPPLAAPGRRSTSRACSWRRASRSCCPSSTACTTATVTTPSGRDASRRQVTAGRAELRRDRRGRALHAVAPRAARLRVAVNLMDADESEPGAAAAARRRRGAARAGGDARPVQRELWPFFVALAAGAARASRACSTGGARRGGRLALPSGAGDRWALGAAMRAGGRARAGAHRADAAAVGRPAERRVPARHVRQREPGRARDAPTASSNAVGRAAMKTGRPGRRSSSFGEQAVVDQPLRRPADGRPSPGAGRRARHQHRPGAPARAGHAAAGPGQPHRAPRPTGARTPATRCGGPGGQGRGRRPLLRARAADVHAGSRRRVDGAAARGQVRRAVPGQGGGLEPKETQGRLSLFRNGEFLGSQVVRLNPGQERLHVPPVARAERHPRLPGARSRSTATPSRRTTARSAPSWCAAGPRCCWPTRTASQAQIAGRRAALAEHRRRPWSSRTGSRRTWRGCRSTTASSCPTSPRSR